MPNPNRRATGDWRSFGAFSAFLVALFTEMHGFPPTIYVLSGWLSTRFPGIDWMSHDAGHVLETIFGWKTNPHLEPFHVISNILIIAGFWLLASAWKVLYEAQRHHRLATTGAYARVRHPQYGGFILIMTGFLFQWPTLVTLVMFPILVFMYVQLARREERDGIAEFGEEYVRYANKTPAVFPRLSSSATEKGTTGQLDGATVRRCTAGMHLQHARVFGTGFHRPKTEVLHYHSDPANLTRMGANHLPLKAIGLCAATYRTGVCSRVEVVMRMAVGDC